VAFGLQNTNYDTKVFSNPETFDPDRFFVRNDDEKAPFPMGAHGGFGVGNAENHHRCAGEKYARIVSALLFAKLLPKYEWRLHGEQNLDEWKDEMFPLHFTAKFAEKFDEKEDETIKYQVILFTGDRTLAGTDSKINVTLHGKNGSATS